ncbi:hypothetical protein TBLA_0D03960 [Henningerozyma blattae CBS 6284]|uniref:RNA exonuclease 3 n=1 Tax=Henningerozyma blattae (strain ATCC 34711 / CBS 6284 / DSM 70876 / NBRC 10599 / NRRL Y-10934 / UCD 77-7) TaxID=1071380 RepID=I2H3E1_HENB6|nr:hypothetical protein TBLA_0D03960 [Tetrapisispora blattae CBS 6284]CCH60893.1 hypothetical protein TBLA_0D03960 [Tetrapisispora blattae CBS 6284]
MSKNALIRPVDLTSQPAPYQERNKILHKLLELMQRLRPNTKGNLEKLAIYMESCVAKKSPSGQSYRFNMSVLFRDLNKAKGDFYQIKIAGKSVLKRKIGDQVTNIGDADPNITVPQIMEKLNKLIHDKKSLVDNGYIMDVFDYPSVEIVSTHVSCDRCNMKFEKKKIMEKTLCKYHILKKQYDRETKTTTYPCCGESSTSTSLMRLGCKTHLHHVFRGSTYSELREISVFTSTETIDGDSNVLALDCEMAFTSKGYEMIRLTIVDFFTSQILLDEIVKPLGEVIDLNTLFSGVRDDDFINSISYEELVGRILNKALINRNSILIGHGLENDLNVMRITHKKIIDTAIIFQKGKFKTSLKNLSFEYLSRRIQTGEHDSSEDAIATMDIVKKKIGMSLTKRDWH